jgi:sugar (pentulose or hexulose) kinase
VASRSRRPALLGIDVGTSGVKVLLYFLGDGRDGGDRVRLARARLRPERPRPGWSEMAPDGWWRAACRAVARLDLSDANVLGVGLSTLFPALVVADRRGRPLRPAILYNDSRSAAEVRDLAATTLTHPALVRLLTGNQVRPGTIALSSLLWVRRHEPNLFEHASLLGMAGSYVGLRLTGRFAIDATSASLTGLYATASGEAWLRGVCRAHGVPPEKMPPGPGRVTYGEYLDLLSADRQGVKQGILGDLPPGADRAAFLERPMTLPEPGWVGVLCDAFGIDAACLPEVLWPADCLGPLTAEAAEALGLRAGIAVAAGAGDTVCSSLGMGLADEGEVAVTCGSTDCLSSLQRTAVFSTRTMNMAYLDAETWLSVAPMNTTGAAVDWFVARFIGRGPKAYERFFALAAQAPPGSGGVVFLPYLAGERSPVFDPRARGVFFGLTLASGKAEMARAVLEGIGFGHRQILRMTDVRLGSPVGRIVAAGGGAAHPLGRQVRADAADRPYRYADLKESSGLGAALLGGVAAGVFGSWRDAAVEARRFVRFQEVRPSPDAWHQLKGNFEVYASLYDALKHCF